MKTLGIQTQFYKEKFSPSAFKLIHIALVLGVCNVVGILLLTSL